ncbi:hypothetical protein G5I_13078 [Acromyrmex echinatior]|uniref:Uncharacterized protein n=1 Tax=Acromyrmex echinatior TaxID=103372 RepID=F4X428_ACREC|nr:hypothetical protein G5I_13078 [Acromyrmex echinatior]
MASGFRVALCRATSFPTRATYVSSFVNQGAPSDCLPISRRRLLAVFRVSPESRCRRRLTSQHRSKHRVRFSLDDRNAPVHGRGSKKSERFRPVSPLHNANTGFAGTFRSAGVLLTDASYSWIAEVRMLDSDDRNMMLLSDIRY